MTHEQEGADLLNAEVRADALHAFTSGLKRGVSGQFYMYRGTYKTDFEWKFRGLWVLLALS